MTNSQKITTNKLRRQIFRYLPQFKIGAIIICANLLLFTVFSFLVPAIRLVRDTIGNRVDVLSFVSSKEPEVKQDNNRTNILLLGTGDVNHDGLNLTDTMILVSIDLKTQDMVMISVPRDIWIDSLKDKVNSAYPLGEEKQKGGGLILAKATVSEILDLPIHYSVRLNFTSFKKAIDLVGGVNVNVENVLDDNLYPLEGRENDTCGGNDPDYKCRYEHLFIDKGPTLMSGDLALKYVRSRHGLGIEETDFARSKRQQKVIIALKDKVMSPKVLLDPTKLRELIKIFGDNIDTDIEDKEIDDIVKIAIKINKNMSQGKTRSFVIDMGDEDTGREGLLISPPIWQYGAWVLLPKTGNWKETQAKAKDFIFNTPTP